MAKKRRRDPDSAAETLEALETWGDRLVQRVSDNPTPILAAAVVILVIAGIVGLTLEFADSDASESAAALAKVQASYRTSMGGTPGTLEIPEPANPETARRVRSEAIGEYQTVASDHPDTAAAALALLEAGKLQQQLGENAAAIASYELGLAQLDPEDPIRAFLLSRMASVAEAEGRYADAATNYEAAAAIPGNPLRFDALADAARTYAQAGDRQQALAALDRIQSEAPEHRLAPYIEARLAELAGGQTTD